MFSRLNAPAAAPIRLLAMAAAVIVIAVAGACSNLTSIDASFPNFTDTTDFFAINGSPPGAPNTINLFSGAAARADQGFAYDLAFDIDASGRAVLIPARALATQFSNPYPVGLQVVPGTFAALNEAPKNGYTLDSTLAVSVGTVVAIESHDAATCQFAIKGGSYFSKLVVTAIDVPNRRISTILTVNRNCGFRSFADGLPKD